MLWCKDKIYNGKDGDGMREIGREEGRERGREEGEEK